MKKALVLGYGISGKSAEQLLIKQGYQVEIVDDKTHPKEITTLSSFAMFVPSPGVPRTHPLYLLAQKEGIPIVGELELALREFSQPSIAVTGTNGKTTVVKMIEHCLNYCGRKAKALGNVGTPLSSYQPSCPEEILVVEVSSFQLETMKTKAFDLGFILNITEDHLDRYDHFEDYAKAKAHLQYCLKEGGILFIHPSIPLSLFPKGALYFHGENEEAVRLALLHFGIERKAFEEAAKTFSKPLHRIEWVAEVEGIPYYNDSKGTNPGALLFALEQIKGNIVLLAGGKDKNLSFAPLKEKTNRLSKVIVFGQARKKIKETLEGEVEVLEVVTVEEAVFLAHQVAKKGETVLFSPGCTSWDAFNNYQERGEFFKSCVLKLS